MIKVAEQRFAVATACVVGAALVMWVTWRQPVVPLSSTMQAVSQPVALPSIQASVDAVLAQADHVLNKAEQLQQSTAMTEETPALIDENRVDSVAWARASEDENFLDKPSFALHGEIRDFEVVKVNRPEILPVVGDRIELPMLDGESVQMTVESTRILNTGDYSMRGHVDGFGDRYPVVITYGDVATFATVTTPEGAFSMEAVDGLGWLYRNPIEAELMHPGATDYLHPPTIVDTHNH